MPQPRVRRNGSGLALILQAASSGGGSCSRRKVDGESGPRTGLALYLDAAVVLAHDAIDGRESQAGSLARWLGGEKGLEDLAFQAFRDSDSIVGHTDGDEPLRSFSPLRGDGIGTRQFGFD